jgi:hopanoid biosynthesis associated protein HpnK
VKRLIVTGDDFGLAEPVNEAIAEAHRHGILTCASLMVGAPAAADAVDRARALPSLRVGLHVVTASGRSLQPPDEIPDLVDPDGELSPRIVRTSFRLLLRRTVRRQLAAEIRSQFEAFAATGLALDHVNVHRHLHLHPLILTLILETGRDFGLRAVRLPQEPPLRSARAAAAGALPRLAGWLFLQPWVRWMKARLRRRGIRCNDALFGLADSGRMTEERVLAILRNLPDGVTELYFHPATRCCPEVDRAMPGYRSEEEFRALTSGAVAAAASGAERIAFADLTA